MRGCGGQSGETVEPSDKNSPIGLLYAFAAESGVNVELAEADFIPLRQTHPSRHPL